MEVDAKVFETMQAALTEAVEFNAEVTPLIQKAAETEAKVAEKVPGLVDDLIKRGFLEPEIREAAVKNLQDPSRLIDAMSKLAAIQGKPTEKSAAAAVPSMGAPETSKTASSHEKPVKESDMVFLKGFGLMH